MLPKESIFAHWKHQSPTERQGLGSGCFLEWSVYQNHLEHEGSVEQTWRNPDGKASCEEAETLSCRQGEPWLPARPGSAVQGLSSAGALSQPWLALCCGHRFWLKIQSDRTVTSKTKSLGTKNTSFQVVIIAINEKREVRKACLKKT